MSAKIATTATMSSSDQAFVDLARFEKLGDGFRLWDEFQRAASPQVTQ